MKARKWCNLFKVCAWEGLVFLLIVFRNVWCYTSQSALAFTQTTRYSLIEKSIICYRNLLLEGELHRVHVLCAVGRHASHLPWMPTAACFGSTWDEQVIGSQVFTKARNTQLRVSKIKLPHKIMLCIWGLQVQQLLLKNCPETVVSQNTKSWLFIFCNPILSSDCSLINLSPEKM